MDQPNNLSKLPNQHEHDAKLFKDYASPGDFGQTLPTCLESANELCGDGQKSLDAKRLASDKSYGLMLCEDIVAGCIAVAVFTVAVLLGGVVITFVWNAGCFLCGETELTLTVPVGVVAFIIGLLTLALWPQQGN